MICGPNNIWNFFLCLSNKSHYKNLTKNATQDACGTHKSTKQSTRIIDLILDDLFTFTRQSQHPRTLYDTFLTKTKADNRFASVNSQRAYAVEICVQEIIHQANNETIAQADWKQIWLAHTNNQCAAAAAW